MSSPYGAEGASYLGFSTDETEAQEIAQEHRSIVAEWELIGKWSVGLKRFQDGWVVLLYPEDSEL